MRILADTNILVRLADPGDRQFETVLRALNSVNDAGHDLVIVPQVLYEFWVVCTRPASDNGLDLSTNEANGELQQAQRFFTLLLDERGIYHRWEQLLSRIDVRGKSAHDARLVAAMERHGLTHILTFNANHFRRYESIVILDAARDPVL